MKTSDIFGNIYHLQRRRRNAGRPYKRHSTFIRWYAKQLRVHKPNNTNKAFGLIGRLFKHEGAIEVLRNIRMLCENNPCSRCPLNNKCPGVMAPLQWTNEMISIMVNVPFQKEGELYEARHIDN